MIENGDRLRNPQFLQTNFRGFIAKHMHKIRGLSRLPHNFGNWGLRSLSPYYCVACPHFTSVACPPNVTIIFY
jgi:hypothetical protein